MYEGGYRNLCRSSHQVLAEGLSACTQIKFHKTSREWLLGDKELNRDARSHSILTDIEYQPIQSGQSSVCTTDIQLIFQKDTPKE